MVNLLAVLVAAVVSMILGILWYSPMVLGTQWRKLLGKKEDRGDMAPKYATNLVGNLVVALVLATVMAAVGAATMFQGAVVGAVFALGFVFMTTLPCVLYECRPFGMHMIFCGYQTLAFVAMGVLIAMLG